MRDHQPFMACQAAVADHRRPSICRHGRGMRRCSFRMEPFFVQFKTYKARLTVLGSSLEARPELVVELQNDRFGTSIVAEGGRYTIFHNGALLRVTIANGEFPFFVTNPPPDHRQVRLRCHLQNCPCRKRPRERAAASEMD